MESPKPPQFPAQPAGPDQTVAPAQYPPAQYPPAQYPPAQYPPAQYPPAQYPGHNPQLSPQYPGVQQAMPPLAPNSQEPPGGWTKAIAWPEKFGLLALAISFVIRVESYKTVNGEILHYSNPTATIGGVVAIVCGVFSLLFLGQTVPGGKSKRLVIALILFGAGGYQVAAGQGVFAKQGQSDNSSRIAVGSHSRNAMDDHRDMQAQAERRIANRSQAMKTQLDQCVNRDDTLACERARKAATLPCNFLPAICSDLGVLAWKGLGGPVDMDKALSLTQIACDGQILMACTNIGVMYRDGEGVSQNLERALKIFETNCSQGYGNACYLIGISLEQAGDKTGARKAFVRSCQAEDEFAQGCRYAFGYLSEGWGGNKDIAAAIPMGVFACNNGFPDACNDVGVLFHNATGVERDLAVAEKFYAAACDGNVGQGCTNYGRVLLIGDDLSLKAFKALERSCQLDDGLGCYGTYVMLSDKKFAMADSAMATIALKKACKLGLTKACN